MNEPVDFHFNVPEESSGYLLWQVTMAWQRSMKRKLDELDITHTQFVILAALAWLSKEQEAVSQVDIAQHSNTDRMMVSKVLRTLEDKKLVVREDHPIDTRAKIIKLSPLGGDLLKKALVVVKAVDDAFFDTLGPYRGVLDLNMKALWDKSKDV
ncbi:MarR family winged helix-turn-helix transcriptional regulator [Myroides pelagicus]|uniref:MarR family transcriptional regulator n=1 Tax=Myroides pelagicus TaxID=270914 RepID=A0A7K1GIG3_9FLAO|nr:MarR family transcriptional regulator [Myroides pelagicus]MEC4113502.1 MarR family transcriptional regulator [Myroides pelagicus]MTH28339.1 MarR family transcriptional regulator [Myroides pelagicus]